jgi:predicted RNase H-like HicB family nuclease
MYVHSRCHPRVPTWAILTGELLSIQCAYCKRTIVRFRVHAAFADTTKDAQIKSNQNYRVDLQYDSEGYWIAKHPELPGCIADGKNVQKALHSLDISRELWIESRLATGLEIPEPQIASER